MTNHNEQRSTLRRAASLAVRHGRHPLSVASILAVAGVAALTLPAERASAAPGDTHTQAVQKGVDFLVPDVVAFTNDWGCVACHRQGAALYGISLAKGAGFSVSLDPVAGTPSIAQAIVTDQQSTGYWDWGGPNDLKSSYNFYGLAGYDKYVSTSFSDRLVAAADWALTSQQPDGQWIMDFEDGYTAHGDVTTTARFMVGIAQAVDRVDLNKATAYKAALAKAAGYIVAHASDTNDVTGIGTDYELSWAIIGLKAAGYADDDPTVASLVAALQAKQSSLGFAWGFQPGDNPDVFNSGMAIYALCKAGVSAIGNASLQQSLEWVNEQQQSNGTWGDDISTTFAILGLSCYGDYGVIVSNAGPVTKVISSHSPDPQTATYDFDIQNHGFLPDTYDLSVIGGMPGWSADIQGTIAIAPGDHAMVALTVHAPANLPEALPVEMTVRATSEAVPTLSGSARITTFTDPPPPTSGDSTAVTLTAGNGASVSLGQSQTLSATVSDTTASVPVVGPGKGVVTFFVAGLAIATDTDADGDGTYTVSFSPDCAWTALGAQDFRAIYSGIDLATGSDLLSSLSSGTITLVAPLCCPKPEICNGVDDDCDGIVDDGNPGGGASCTTGYPGACQSGALACTNGGVTCVAAAQPNQLAETCNGVDDDCNGIVDDGFHVGDVCHVGVGACAATGVMACDANGQSACSAQPGTPSPEICGDAIDSDCDGNTDNGCACLHDADCGGATSGQICDTGPGGTYTCVLGCHAGAGTNGCASGLHCTSTNGARGACVACLVDLDCGAADSGVVCDENTNACVSGCRGSSGNHCGPGLSCTSADDSIGSCLACLVDADCGDATSGIVCDAGKCIAGCRASGGNGCGAALSCTSADATVGKCTGCVADATCGALDSGIVCDTTTDTCVAGCRGAGGNACPTGSACSSKTDSLGVCVPTDGGPGPHGTIGRGTRLSTGSTSTGAGGAGGATSNSGAADSANASGSGASPTQNGCSCSVDGRGETGGLGWLAAGLGVAVVSRRRRRAA